MARQRTATASLPVSVKDIKADLRYANYAKAMAAASRLIELIPNQDNYEIYLRTLATCLEGFLRTGKVNEFQDAIQRADEFAQHHESFRSDLAAILARYGEFDRAIRLENSPRVRMHIADLCVRRNRIEAAPVEVANDFPALQQAIADYELGRDEAARERLQQLGLASPFQQWKLLIRGLMAHAAGNPARALENWQRLLPEYLPAALAAPLRIAIDPDWGRSLPEAQASEYRSQSESLNRGGVVESLRKLNRLFDRRHPLKAIWKPLGELMPTLSAKHPHLIPRLARYFYHAIVTQGTPDDLKRYRQIFRPPSDDPHYDRLQAMACEAADCKREAIQHWRSYESWLAKDATGWEPDLLARARAIILLRIGRLVSCVDTPLQGMDQDALSALQKLIGFDTLTSTHGKPDDYFLRSMKLAPDWSEPALDLMDCHLDGKNWGAAELVATQFLDRCPDNEPMLERLVTCFQEQRKDDARLAAARRLLAVNPLHPELDEGVTLATVTALRRHMIHGQYEDCDRLLAEARESDCKRCPMHFGSLRAMLGRIRKRPDEIASGEELAFQNPQYRLAASWCLAYDGLLMKLKPAQGKVADARLKECFQTEAPSPVEVLHLYRCWLQSITEGFHHSTQATHGRKIMALAERTPLTRAPLEDFEDLLLALDHKPFHKSLLKLSRTLQARFPESPVFPYCEVVALTSGRPTRRTSYRIGDLLIIIKSLLKGTNHPRYRRITDSLDRFEKIVGQPLVIQSFLDDAFPFG